jgi:hypothetical protein
LFSSLALACSADQGQPSASLGGDGAFEMDGSDVGGGDSAGGSAGGDAPSTPNPGTPAGGCEKMDILFVIDNSGSMQEEQQNLAANFPRFIEVLDAFQGEGLDYRVGITTTAFPTEVLGIPLGGGEEGALLKDASMTHPWLSRGEANVAETFTKIATVGTEGSGQEQPLRAANAAVSERVADGTNAGFLRDDALLALVFLTDEDDQSAEQGQMNGLPIALPGNEIPIATLIEGFDAVKGGRARWATAVIAGSEAPTCSSQFGDAAYAARLLEFVQQTGENAVFSSICEGDLSKALEDALSTFALACDNFEVI